MAWIRAVVIGSVAIACYASHVAAADPWIAQVNETLREHASIIQYAESQARLVLRLAVAIGLFGVILAATQGTNAKAVKVLGVVLGLVVGGLTVVREQMYPFSPKEVDATISDIDSHDRSIRRQLALYSPEQPADNLQEIKKVVDPLLDQVEALIKRLPRSYSITEVTLLPFVSMAYANGRPDDSLRDWQARVEKDIDSLYFIGLGVAPELKSARQRSEQEARDSAGEALVEALSQGGRRVDTVGIRRVVERLRPVDGSTAFDRETGLYRVQTLMGINIRQAKLELAWAASQDREQEPSGIQEQLGAITKAAQWRALLSWCSQDRGEPDCPDEYLKAKAEECLKVGHRACLIELARKAASSGDCDRAVNLAGICQCQNPNGRKGILTSATSVCAWLKDPQWVYYGNLKNDRSWEYLYFRREGGDDPNDVPSIGDTVVAKGQVNVRKGPIEHKGEDWTLQPARGYVTPGQRLRVLAVKQPPADMTDPDHSVWIRFEAIDEK